MTSKKRASNAPDSRPRHGEHHVHRIVFVTGKGGVGKSVVAAATALQFARAGQSVLLVELGSRSFYGPLLGLSVGTDAVSWKPQIGIARWDVESALREYIARYLVFKIAADKILNNIVMKALLATAPGLAELAILGKLTAPMRHGWYKRDVDVVVVDAYATGQFMALLRAPYGLAQIAPTGPMHTHAASIFNLISDSAICEYRLVTLAEEMPIAEACDMAREIRRETGIAPSIYCNRLIDLPSRLPSLRVDDPATSFVDHMQRIAARQRESLQALAGLGANRAGPVRQLPLIATTDAQCLLEALADGLGAVPVASS
jgi:anion-transporting  ArsA/GET3 family ATPase